VFLVKEHPASVNYFENGIIEQHFGKIINNTGNIFMIGKDVSTSSLISYVDVVITQAGTIGLEFSSYGIPSIITAKAFYSNQGFTIEPKNKAEYLELINNISRISKLNSIQTLAAKILLYKYNLIPKSYYTQEDLSLIADKSKSHLNKISRFTQDFKLDAELVTYYDSIFKHYFSSSSLKSQS
jgi:lipid A disaccharide synthetase